MTALLILLGVCAVASTILLGLIYRELCEYRHTLAAQGSQRRQWVKQERTP